MLIDLFLRNSNMSTLPRKSWFSGTWVYLQYSFPFNWGEFPQTTMIILRYLDICPTFTIKSQPIPVGEYICQATMGIRHGRN